MNKAPGSYTQYTWSYKQLIEWIKMEKGICAKDKKFPQQIICIWYFSYYICYMEMNVGLLDF